MGSGNWIVDNLNSALEMWNGRLAAIWQLISTSPESFKGGGVWNVIVNINDGLKAVGYALLVLFFVMGVVKTCGSFTEMKKPEVAFKCFIRFVLAQAAVSWGMELMTGAFRVAQGMVTTIMDSSGLTAMSATTLPDELVSVIEDPRRTISSSSIRNRSTAPSSKDWAARSSTSPPPLPTISTPWIWSRAMGTERTPWC